jgi:hypothetical protein
MSGCESISSHNHKMEGIVMIVCYCDFTPMLAASVKHILA